MESDYKRCVALLLTCALLLLFWGVLTIWVATGFSVAGIVVSLVATIAIVSAIGSTVMERSFADGELAFGTVDVSSIPVGAYTVIVRWPDHRASQPLLITR